MRSIFRFLIVLVAAVACSARGQALPEFRPAVLGSGPESLINRIDADALIKKGQKDGAIMFCSQVDKSGQVLASWTYRKTADTDALEEELTNTLKGVRFPPAIYEHQPVGVLLFASVFFSAANTPHVHIYLNQDGNELRAKSDFIAPQPVFGADSKFTGLHGPTTEMPVLVTAIVDLGLKVDDKGNLQELHVLEESPPLLGFGNSAEENFRGAKFIPAFRSGAPDESTTSVPICYKLGAAE